MHLLSVHSWPQMKGSRIPWHSLLPVPEQSHTLLCALNGVGSAAMAKASCPYHQANAAADIALERFQLSQRSQRLEMYVW